MRQLIALPNKTGSQSARLGNLNGLLFGAPEKLALTNAMKGDQYSGFGSIIEVDELPRLHFLTPPATILLRGLAKFADLDHCSAKLALAEARHALPEGTISLLAAVGDTTSSVSNLASVWPALPRLNGLVFVANRLLDHFSLPATVPDEECPDPIRLARSLTVLKAKELNIPAIIWKNEMDRDPEYDHRAHRDGFSAKISAREP